MRFLTLAVAATLLLPLADVGRSQEGLWSPDGGRPAADQPDKASLTVTPAGEPIPAMKYRLLPTDSERTPGNAPTNYYRALLHMRGVPREHFQIEVDNTEAWAEDRPLDDATVAAIKTYLAPFENAFGEVKLAAYRQDCDWNLELEQLRGVDVVMYLLHDFQEMRTLARLLDLRFRVELYENRLDDAWETLRQGMQLGIDSARPPLLINGLIGIAIESIMLRRLEDFIAHPDAPNVYWALAALPEPLVDLRPSIEFEMSIGPRMFPALVDPERPRSVEEWEGDVRATWETLRTIAPMTGVSGDGLTSFQGAALFGFAVTRYASAKAFLIEQGRDAAEVEAMPVGQVLMLAEKATYLRAADDLMKIYYLPMDQRLDLETEAQRRTDELLAQEPIPIASLLLPAVHAAARAQDRLVFRVRGLQTVEALRAELARAGEFPTRLQGIAPLPPRLDPYTNENFAYEKSGGMASLRVIVPGVPMRGSSRVYELRKRVPGEPRTP